MAKLYWSGEVGWRMNDEGITIQSVKEALDNLNGEDLEVELTTLGGDFFQASPIMNLIRSYRGKKKVFVNGIVASAGTVIAMGFDEIIARPTSMFMIHNAQSFAWGDHNDMREQAELNERMSNTIAEEYTLHLGGDPKNEDDPILKKVKKWMDDETWFMGQEIVDAGFATSLESGTEQKASSMHLIVAQNQFREFVTMRAKRKPNDNPDAGIRSSIESMIESGAVDKTTGWTQTENDKVVGLKADANGKPQYPIAKNGKVYRSALRSVAARAAADDPELAQWATAMIAKIDAKKGATQVNEEEVIAFLKDKPAVFARVAAGAGFQGTLATAAHTAALELKAKLDAENIADPLAEIKRLRAEIEAVDGDKVKNALDAEFGIEKDAATGVVNNLRIYAGEKLAGVKSADLGAKVAEFKKSPLALKLAGERMDANSDQNVFGLVDGKKKSEALEIEGAPVTKV